MFRVTKVERFFPRDIDPEGTEVYLHVTMETFWSDPADIVVKLAMPEYETDEMLLAESRKATVSALLKLASELQKSLPATE